MQGLVVVGLIFEEILNINIKCVEVTGVHNIQGSFSGAISRYSRIFLQEIASKFQE